MKDFKELLNAEIKKAAKNYQEAKDDAIRDLQAINTRQAVDYGAGYYSHIEKITRYAAELNALDLAYRIYEYCEEKAKEEAE